MYKLTLIAASVTLALTHAHAQTQRDLDSHEHGAASMNIAIEGTSIYIELDSPWNNLVGFEHAPSTEQQHQRVDEAMTLLQEPSRMFSFTSATCTVNDIKLESSLAMVEEHAHGEEKHDDHDHDEEHAHGEEKHDDHDHDEEHAHGEEKHDDHDHGGHDHDEETHSEVFVAYELSCNNLDELAVINVEFLNVWSGFEDLDVQVIGPNGQALVELGQGNTQIDVSSVL